MTLIDINNVTLEDTKRVAEAFSEISIMYNRAMAENLTHKVSIAKLEAENTELKRANTNINHLYHNACEVNLRLQKQIDHLKAQIEGKD